MLNPYSDMSYDAQEAVVCGCSICSGWLRWVAFEHVEPRCPTDA